MSRKVLKRAALRTSERESSHKVIDREVFEAHEQARRILDRAEERAAEKLRAVEEQAEALRRDGWHRGYREGLADWQEKVALLLDERRQLIEGAEPTVVELALAVTRKILRRQLEIDGKLIVPVVRDAMRSLVQSPSQRIEIALHPDDQPAVEELLAEMRARDPHWGSIVLSPDERLERGGCRIDSEFGQVDASLETQLAAIRLILQPAEASEPFL